MLIETRCLGTTDHALSEQHVSEALAAALASEAALIRRIRVSLRAVPGRSSCRLVVTFLDGASLIVDKRARTLPSAFQASLAALARCASRRQRPSRAAPGNSAPQARATPPPRGAQPLRESSGKVLFALPGFGSPSHSLRRAQRTALALRLDLHVVRVVPETNAGRADPMTSLAEAMLEAQRLLFAHREARRWCDAVLQERLPELRVGVRAGEFVAEAARCARSLNARLIIVPPLQGRLVTALALASRLPVFVARRSVATGAWPAAAKLAKSPEVLRGSTSLARHLPVPVVPLRDTALRDTALRGPAALAGASAGQAKSGDAPRAAGHGRERAGGTRTTPQPFAALLRSRGTVVMPRENDPVRAIVKHTAHAGAVVPGDHPRPAHLQPKAAARVIDGTSGCILVVPIAAARTDGRAGPPQEDPRRSDAGVLQRS